MKPLRLSRLVKELKRRRVFRGVIVYGASTLILLEAADNLCTAFGIEAVPKWFVFVLAIGFFISLWFSWIYDITPGGIRKTEPASEQSVHIPRKEISIYKATTFASVLIIIGLFSYRIIDRSEARLFAGIEKSIAVLPLEDNELHPADLRRYEFIGHEITTCLLNVRDYHITPWEDCRKYPRNAYTSYRQMGEDLSAALLVDWRPHETGTEKHLSVDLIAAVNHDLLWSENFEIKGNWPSEICRNSRKISKKIIRKLRTPLTPKERALISEIPISARATMYASLGTAMTNDVWEMVRTGEGSIDTVRSEYTDSLSFDRAIQLFNDAIGEDPEFAAAYAQRAKARLWGIEASFIDKAEIDKCEEDIRKAFALDPGLPEAHVAMGFFYYYGIGDLMLAITSFEKAAHLRPGSIEYAFYLSIIRRALGHWNEVRVLSDAIFEGHPRNALFLTNLGISYLYLQDFSKSIVCQDRAIAMLPHWFAPYVNKAEALISLGQLEEARAVLQEATENTGKQFYKMTAFIDLYERNFNSAIEHVEKAEINEYLRDGGRQGDDLLLKAKIYTHAGLQKQARNNYSEALDYYKKQLMFHPEDYPLYSKMGIACAGLGMFAEAEEYGKKAHDFTRQKDSPKETPFILHELIQLYAMSGDRESARRMKDELLDRNTFFTPELLKYDPDIQNILEAPGF